MQITKKAKLFGKESEIIIFDVDNFMAEIVIDDAFRLGSNLHKIFDIYDEKSEISLLNKKRELKVSDYLLEVINKAIHFSKITNGAYDITHGKNFLLRKKGEISLPTLNCSYKDIKIVQNKITLTHPDILIDLGSVAKGYITDKMSELIKNEGIESFIIDSRGDLIVVGNNQLIGIGHPREKDKILKTINIQNKGVATSGDYHQFVNNFKNSHIINSKDLISVTVVADTLTEAELFSTALFVMDKTEREKLMSKHKNILAMLIDENLNIIFINHFDKLLHDVV